MTPDAAGSVERVPVNLRVGELVKEQYEQTIRENRGVEHPYVGFVLERELRCLLGVGRISDLADSAQDLADRLGEQDREKKIPVPDRSEGESPQVCYRIPDDLRDLLMREADRSDIVDSAGELVEGAMWRYAEGDGVLSRTDDRVERVAEHVDPTEPDAVERRTQAIAAGVEAGSGFTFEDFREAMDARADGISPSTGTPSKTERAYLERVVDQLGYEWHSKELFADPDAVDVPEHPDPTTKPYHFMDESDKILAVKYTALDRARQSHNGRGKFDHSEAKAALDNRPQSASGLMQQIGECAGFSYDSTEEVLKVNAERALDAVENREAVAALLGETDDAGETDQNADGKGGGSADETTAPDSDLMDEPDRMEDSDSDAPANTADDADGDGWIRDVVDSAGPDLETLPELPDAVIRTAIAKHRHGTTDTGEAKHRERVPDSDVTAVKTYAEGIDTTDDDDAREADDETEGTGDLAASARDDLDALAAGTPANATAVTDGGETDERDSDDDPPLVADGGTATASSASGSTLLESRSLGCGPTCPTCGGRLRDASGDLTAECIRCNRRVSLVTVVEQLGDGGGM